MKAAAAVWAACALATAARAEDAPAAKVQAALKLIDQNKCAEALALAQPLADAPDHAGLSPSDLDMAAAITVECERRTDKDRGYRDAVRYTDQGAHHPYLWAIRLAGEISQPRPEAAVKTLELLGERHPATLSQMPPSAIYRAAYNLRAPELRALRLRGLKVLATRYEPVDPFLPVDTFRLEYAGLLMEVGQGEEAARFIAGLSQPRQLIEASLDGRFSGLPQDLDVRAAAERQLARDEAELAKNPTLLRGVIAVAEDLRVLGRDKEALAKLDTAAGKLDDPRAFADDEPHVNWWWNDRAGLLSGLGRYDEAVDAMRRGAAAGEGGSAANVSQMINLAGLYLRAGQPDKALALVEHFDVDRRRLSPVGEMELRFVRVCSLSRVGRAGEAAPDLAYARVHERDDPAALTGMLLCAGDQDSAAAVMIRRLADPALRGGALMALCDFDDPPVKPKDALAPAYKAMAARADVKAAAARVGQVRRFRIREPRP
jgi:tetratricopeptide (TPR) repeat protein